MAGLIVTASDINSTAGDIYRSLIYNMRRGANLKRFLDRFTAQQLVDNFGMTIGDANLLKSAVGEFSAIGVTFQANRVFIDQVAGLGDV